MKTRGFEKISAQVNNPDIKLPRRATKHSVGYDFYSPIDATIPAGETIKIFTGIKAYMLEDEGLFFYPRSSWGNKYGIILANSVAVFDPDYYDNADTEGEAILTLRNTSKDDFEIKKGDRFCQAVFKKFLLADDDVADGERLGGVGSTGK